MKYYSGYLRDSRDYLSRLVEALDRKFEYASILGTDIRGTQYGIRNELLHFGETELVERGFVARVYTGVVYAEYSFNAIGEESLGEIETRIIETADNASRLASLTGGEQRSDPLIEEEKLTREFERESVSNGKSTEKIMESLREISDAMGAYDVAIVQRSVSLEIAEVSKIFISKKRDLAQFYNWCSGMVIAAARTQKGTRRNSFMTSGKSFERTLALVREKSLEVCRTAVLLGSAVSAIPGEYDAVVTPDVAGIIAHEAFGHGVEMDMFVKNRAKAPQYMNEPIANPCVTMYDGAGAFEQTSSYFFDDEGTLADKTLIIENGILISGINDALSALRLKVKPTGNGRRESFERKAYTRMTNTYFTAGSDGMDAMIQGIKRGYVIHGAESGMEDPKNWGIQCVACYGEEIVDGKLTGKIISPVVMTGYVPDLLMSIAARGSETEICGTGYCGKGHKEYIKVSSGGPCMKLKVKIG